MVKSFRRLLLVCFHVQEIRGGHIQAKRIEDFLIESNLTTDKSVYIMRESYSVISYINLIYASVLFFGVGGVILL